MNVQTLATHFKNLCIQGKGNYPVYITSDNLLSTPIVDIREENWGGAKVIVLAYELKDVPT